ncbi:MAG TPA: class I SAM-dependent methyltransferase [Pyrinomonadaceae bacterium]|nr:class I SAM-dependent methyltransferase [Pyrinomonadaceae bacterium]
MIDVIKHNSSAWDKAVDELDGWTIPVSSETVDRARHGDWRVILTPGKAVPREWFGEISGKDVLCLASGGGQQAPVLAAAGAHVTSFDNSARQLEQDRFVAERDGLEIRIEKGDAADLSRFPDGSFDIIFHPCSNLFMPNLEPIWKECFRVLRSPGTLLTGFTKPEVFIFDEFEEETNRELVVRHSLPYSDEESLSDDDLRDLIERGQALEYSHTLEEQIGGQTSAGFHIVGLYEDEWNNPDRVINLYMPAFIATRAIKP